MSDPDQNALTATVLEASASGYAAAAEAALHDIAPPLATSAGTGAAGGWRAHLLQRILELAAAIRVHEPELFARRIGWLRGAMRARRADDAALRSALCALRLALDRELPPQARGVALAPIDAALQQWDRPLEGGDSSLDPASASTPLVLAYLEACLSTEPDRAIRLVLEALGELSPERIYTEVLAPAQREIGRLWHADEATVVEERLVSETTRRLMAILVHRCAPPPQSGKCVLSACVVGNAHDLGLRMVSDLFVFAGWRSIFLGADVPAEQVTRAVKTFDVDLLVLTATLATQLGEAASTIRLVKRSAPQVRVLVGGLAFEDAPAAARRIGADAYAGTIDGAVAAGDDLIRRMPRP